jgi:hypothetical protein
MTWVGWMRRCASRTAMRRISRTGQRISERATLGGIMADHHQRREGHHHQADEDCQEFRVGAAG